MWITKQKSAVNNSVHRIPIVILRDILNLVLKQIV